MLSNNTFDWGQLVLLLRLGVFHWRFVKMFHPIDQADVSFFSSNSLKAKRKIIVEKRIEANHDRAKQKNLRNKFSCKK